jgi:hypothetical protein
MKNVNPRISIIVVLIFFLRSILLLNGLCQLHAQNTFENYYLYINAYPNGAVSWGENELEAQGITHDNWNWYITATQRWSLPDFDIQNCYLWKIPVNEDLNANVFTNPNVTYKDLYDFPELWNDTGPWNDTLTGYIHWGDLDHYTYNNKQYLVVPMTSPTSELDNPAIAVFRTSDLSLAGIGHLLGGGGIEHIDVGWCAVDSISGILYSSNDLTDFVFQYQVSWNELPDTGCNSHLNLTWKRNCLIKDVNGNIDTLHNMQGGEFTSSGKLLYLSSGRGFCYFGAEDAGDPSDGINVFVFDSDSNFHQIRHSTNRCYEAPYVSDCDHPWSDCFDLTYDFNCGMFETHADQPQGLTIWDIDNKGAPGMSGQLHVLTASIGLAGNMAQLHHFSGRLFVDPVNGTLPSWEFPQGPPIPGTAARPFKTLRDAFTWCPVWDGAEIILKPGSSAETAECSARVKIISQGGSGIVGEGGATVKGVQLFQHPNYRGAYWFFNTNIPDLDHDTINFDNVTSSVRIYSPGVQLWDYRNYAGGLFPATQNIPDLTPYNWNDRVGSVSFISGPVIGVQLFEHPNYLGSSYFFSSDNPDLDNDTINFNDVTSSVKLYNLNEVRLFFDNNYGGASITITHDISEMPSGWNDEVSSLKIISKKKKRK